MLERKMIHTFLMMKLKVLRKDTMRKQAMIIIPVPDSKLPLMYYRE
jgi:hypothetical protein